MLAKIGMVASLASSVVGAMGAAASADAQADAMELEAKAEEKRAAWERARGQHEAERQRKETDMVMGRQKALMAASGGGVTADAEDTVVRTAAQGALQADINMVNSEEQARGMEDNASAKRAAASATRTAGRISAGTSLLSGVSGFARSGGFSGARTTVGRLG